MNIHHDFRCVFQFSSLLSTGELKEHSEVFLCSSANPHTQIETLIIYSLVHSLPVKRPVKDRRCTAR